MIKMISLFFCLFISKSLFAHQIEVKTAARLYSSASSKADVIEVANGGEKFDVKERRGMFWLISLDGEEAYIKVSDSKRLERPGSGLEEALYQAALSHRQSGDTTSQRTRSGAMGVRGLSDSSVNISDVASLRPNLNAVYLMEDREIFAEELRVFESLLEAEIEGVEKAKSDN